MREFILSITALASLAIPAQATGLCSGAAFGGNFASASFVQSSSGCGGAVASFSPFFATNAAFLPSFSPFVSVNAGFFGGRTFIGNRGFSGNRGAFSGRAVVHQRGTARVRR